MKVRRLFDILDYYQEKYPEQKIALAVNKTDNAYLQHRRIY
jgi:hypothetical protein